MNEGAFLKIGLQIEGAHRGKSQKIVANSGYSTPYNTRALISKSSTWDLAFPGPFVGSSGYKEPKYMATAFSLDSRGSLFFSSRLPKKVSGALLWCTRDWFFSDEKYNLLYRHLFPRPGRNIIVVPSRASGLEAFSHNPTDGSSAPIASQPSANTNYLNQRFLSYWVELLSRRPVISRVKLTCLTTV